MEEVFLLAGKENIGKQAPGEGACVIAESAIHHPPLEGVETQLETKSNAVFARRTAPHICQAKFYFPLKRAKWTSYFLTIPHRKDITESPVSHDSALTHIKYHEIKYRRSEWL